MASTARRELDRGREWRRCRLTVVLPVLLLALRGASAAVLGAGGIPRHGEIRGKKQPREGRPMAPEANRGDLRGRNSHEAVFARTSAPTDVKGTYTRDFARKNSGEEFSAHEKKLRIAVPHKHGFQAFVNINHPETKRPKVTGYSIDVFKRALEKLNNPPQYEFCVFDGTYDELVGNVSIRIYDAAVGDVSITAKRVMEAEFTMPYTQSGLSLLVLSENDSKSIRWIFLEPLTKELWIATVGGFLFTGFVVWMIEHPRNLEYQGPGLRQISNALYFAFSTMTFSHEPIIRSPLSKIVLVVWCFAVLVLVQSYTANLSSMLTAKRLVTDLNQLVQSADYIGFQEGSLVRLFLQEVGVTEKRMRALRNQTEYAQALRKGSKNGGVSAIVDEIPYVNYFLLDPRYKKEFRMFNHIYRTLGLGFVFPLGSPLAHDLSIAILDMTQGNEVSEMEEKWFGRSSLSAGSYSSVTDSVPLTLQSFSGLFIITGCVSTLMLLIRVARSVYDRCTRIRGTGLEDPDESDPDNGTANLRESGDLQIGSESDERHSEDRNEQSLQVHVSSGNVGDAEPCQTHNGSVTADSVQIQMTGQGVGMAPGVAT